MKTKEGKITVRYYNIGYYGEQKATLLRDGKKIGSVAICHLANGHVARAKIDDTNEVCGFYEILQPFEIEKDFDGVTAYWKAVIPEWKKAVSWIVKNRLQTA
jgi:hypothetical protein